MSPETDWNSRIGTQSYLLVLKLILRAIDSKNGESNDSSENSVFLLLHQNDPFGELFSEI